MRLPVLFLLLAFAMTACKNKSTQTGDDKTVTSESDSKTIRNKISVKSTGVKVQQAFLLFEDNKLVPADNKVEVGQRVRLRLILEGWKAVNGKVFLGASEKITTDDNRVILDEQDLFASYTAGIDPADAGVITLSAEITSIDKLFKYFEVAFRVWDKNTEDNATGSYRLYLK